MGFIKKYTFVIAPLCLIFLYFVSRLFNILALPIFTDEAIYIRWAQIAENDAAWRFISLTDGKQPLFVWIGMILMKVINDPLLAGRLVSVFAGFLSMIGIFFLASELFKNKQIGFLAAFIYVLYPFALVYDRMALYDSLVAMFVIWSLYFEVLLVRHIKLDLALILGMIIGGGMLTKTSANFALLFILFTLLLFNFKDKQWKKKLRNWIIFAVVAVILGNVIYAILRLSPFYYIINDKNLVFVYPLKEWINHPFAYYSGNISALLGWLISYMTIPVITLIFVSFIVKKKKYVPEKVLLFVCFLIPFIYLAFFGRVIYPRFILFMTMPLLVLGAYALYHLQESIKYRWMKSLIIFVFTGLYLFTDFFIITDFARAAIPQADRGQFITGWPSGVGVQETVEFLQGEAKKGNIYVATQGTFGLMPSALEIYLVDNPNVTIKGFWPIKDQPPAEVLAASKKMPTYFVFFQSCSSCKAIGQAPPQWRVKEVFRVRKIEQDSYYTLYQITSP